MQYELYDFQEDAVVDLVKKMKKMQWDWHEDGERSSVALTDPTGAGKTVICGATIEIFGIIKVKERRRIKRG